MVMIIESPLNPVIKEVAGLHQKKNRDEVQAVLVEGKHPIEEAVKANLKVYQCFALDEASLPKDLPDSTLQVLVSKKVMAKLASTDSPVPCIAAVEKPDSPPLTEIKGKNRTLLVLDRLQDPGNLGTLIRSAMAFGISAVVLTDCSVDPYNPKAIRSSAGLVFHLPIITTSGTLRDTLESLEKLGFQLMLTRGDGDDPKQKNQNNHYKSMAYQGELAFVLGNEGQGIDTSALVNINPGNMRWVSIPMQDGVDSLNVSVCGSILLAEAAAQRQSQ